MANFIIEQGGIEFDVSAANEAEAQAKVDAYFAEQGQPAEEPEQQTYMFDKHGIEFDVKANSQEEAIAKVEAYFAENYPDPYANLTSESKKGKAYNDDLQTVEQFDAVDPATLSKKDQATYRSALERVGQKARLDSLAAGDIAEGRTMDPRAAVGEAARIFTEAATGLGDEAGALGQLFRGQSVAEFMEDPSGTWGEAIDDTRNSMDDFEERNAEFATALKGAGLVSGLAIPTLGNAKLAGQISKGTGLSKAKSTGLLTAAEGAAYGFASGEDAEGRLAGAALGATVGGALGMGASKLSDKVSAWADEKAIKALKEAEEETAALESGQWVDRGKADKMNSPITRLAVGISDAVRRNISKEAGGRIQRADETAMRQKVKDTDEYLDGGYTERGDTPKGVGGKPKGNPGFTKVLTLEKEDTDFAGAILDYAKGDINRGQLLAKLDESLNKSENAYILTGPQKKDVKHVTKNMSKDYEPNVSREADAAKALTNQEKAQIKRSLVKYLDWSNKQNAKYNKKIGESALDASNYLHTRVRPEVARKKIRRESAEFDEVGPETTRDAGEMARQRGSYAKGEVDPSEYQSTLMTNANRIFSNNRLLQMQEKFGVEDVEGGPDALMAAIERVSRERGLSEEGAAGVRNAVATLQRGQNQHANAWFRAFQNIGYSVLAGPKSAIINLQDLPTAMWNNGIRGVSELMNKKLDKRTAEAIGINKQNVGEFVQALRGAEVGTELRLGPIKVATWRKGLDAEATAGEKVENFTGSLLDNMMRWSMFQTSDMAAKNGVMRIVMGENIKLAKEGKLAKRWGTYFNKAELDLLESELKRVGDNVEELNPKASELFDEMNTLGLGQQQLISAAGRPPAWLNNPQWRPIWMMRGFAVKQNALIMDKVVDKIQAGDIAGATKQMAGFVVLPGASYGGLNLLRQEMFGHEDYEPTAEEFMWSVTDAVLGPLTMNSIGVGNQYGRMKLSQNPVGEIMMSALPPLGYLENGGEALAKAIREEDPEALLDVLYDQPITKQYMRAAGIEEDD